MSERTNTGHIDFRSWLKETEFTPQRPKEAHLLAVTDKRTGKICDIAVTQNRFAYRYLSWKLKHLYPEDKFTIEQMQTDLRDITRR